MAMSVLIKTPEHLSRYETSCRHPPIIMRENTSFRRDAVEAVHRPLAGVPAVEGEAVGDVGDVDFLNPRIEGEKLPTEGGLHPEPGAADDPVVHPAEAAPRIDFIFYHSVASMNALTNSAASHGLMALPKARSRPTRAGTP